MAKNFALNIAPTHGPWATQTLTHGIVQKLVVNKLVCIALLMASGQQQQYVDETNHSRNMR
jgi:hypothetical protein